LNNSAVEIELKGLEIVENEDNQVLIKQLVHSVRELQGISSAHNNLIYALMSVVCEKAPTLIDEIKDKIKDVADLQIQFEIKSEISKTSFQNEITQSLKHFEAVEQAALLSQTYIEVKDKK
jgi:hypothetical protein